MCRTLRQRFLAARLSMLSLTTLAIVNDAVLVRHVQNWFTVSEIPMHDWFLSERLPVARKIFRANRLLAKRGGCSTESCRRWACIVTTSTSVTSSSVVRRIIATHNRTRWQPAKIFWFDSLQTFVPRSSLVSVVLLCTVC